MQKEKVSCPSETAEGLTRTSLWRIILYSLLPAAGNLFMMLFAMNTYIANGGFGLSMAVAASIASAAQIWDAVTDPVIAVIVPKINTRFGAARPIMVTGLLITILASYGALFWLPGSGAVSWIICYFGYFLGRTIMNQGKNIASNILTKDPTQRPLIGRCTQIYTIVIAALLSVYRSKILFPKYGKISFPLLQEFGRTVIIIGAVFIFLACIAISQADTKENIAANYRPGVKINLLDMLRMFKENPAFLTCVISDATDKMANEVTSASVVTTLVFGILIGNYKFTGDISIIVSIVTIVLIFFITGVARKQGAGRAYLKFTKLACLVIVAMFVFMLTGAYKSVSVSVIPTVIFVALYALLSAAKSTTSACMVTMYQDVADYQFYLTGQYMPGLVVATITMSGKIVKALGDLMIAGFLAWIGYTNTTPQPNDPETPELFWVTMLMWLGMMLIGWVASIIAMKWYPLDNDKMTEIQKANKKKRAENMALKAGR
ncbi:MAG: MFS transporter [Lachnospiraceae bacterium]|jgi:Na+/melibiose symporter-like transporter|nr:MFS transporter [Lachnospiraceae bacterium]MCH4071043.1 MFS transporter [Lachnospiraceae bacterium]MCH4108114.1 MFS transporter [Lachnospiraceae bacterium]MCI1331915.1 MFS transporter [Lachnospiraceae bacterium]MCI1360677.1 MFS transporter [Lachnospiraceae bacterium]